MKYNKLNAKQKEELFELYKTYQYTYKELAEKFNKSVSSISCLLTRNNLKGKRVNNHYRIYPINQNFFDVIDSEEKAYFLGILCADGCNHVNNTKISIFLKESDKNLIVKLNHLLQPDKPLTYSRKKSGFNQYGLQISNKRISDKLSELGCIPQKTFTLDLPTYDQVPENMYSHYIRGFFDGDGWLGKKDISITSSNLFCSKLAEMLLTKYDIKTRIRFKNKVSELCFRRSDVLSFLNWIYKDANIFLERKYQRYLEYHKINLVS